jgi:hypothetical protein
MKGTQQDVETVGFFTYFMASIVSKTMTPKKASCAKEKSRSDIKRVELKMEGTK